MDAATFLICGRFEKGALIQIVSTSVQLPDAIILRFE